MFVCVRASVCGCVCVCSSGHGNVTLETQFTIQNTTEAMKKRSSVECENRSLVCSCAVTLRVRIFLVNTLQLRMETTQVSILFSPLVMIMVMDCLALEILQLHNVFFKFSQYLWIYAFSIIELLVTNYHFEGILI